MYCGSLESVRIGQLSDIMDSHTVSFLFFALLVVLVVITSMLGKPKRRGTATHFPPPLGVKLIVWVSLACWIFLLLGPIGLGMYWLAALFALGPLYTIWRWPVTISIDELRIYQHAWCHPKASMLWEEVASIQVSRFGNVLVLRGRTGDSIKIPTAQVGVYELIGEIKRRTGIEVRLL
jgi:hypothetical protein